MLTGMTLVCLAIVALPQLGFAQSSPQIGTWKLNLQKSEFIPGPAPRSRSLNITQDGQNIRDTVQEIDAQGNVSTSEVMHVYDGQPHPAPGHPGFDATVITKVDANPFSLIAIRLKAGKLVQVGTFVISHDGKTLTTTITGINVNGQPIKAIAVYDKQSTGTAASEPGDPIRDCRSGVNTCSTTYPQIYCSADGETHFQEVTVPLTLVQTNSDPLFASTINSEQTSRWIVFPKGWNVGLFRQGVFHTYEGPNTRKRFVSVREGTITIRATDGEERTFKKGDIFEAVDLLPCKGRLSKSEDGAVVLFTDHP
jgi:hypothetical protein